MRWIVTQIGSREHYSVPRAFHNRGRLEHFYTDLWCRYGAELARKLPDPLAPMGNRYHPGLPSSKVTAFNLVTLRRMLAARRAGPNSMKERYESFDAIGREFATLVNRQLQRGSFDPHGSAAFLFSTGALETSRLLRELKVPVVVDQLDPARLDEQMVRSEVEKWPNWEELPGKIPESYYQRLAEEWDCADLILVNSQWSARNLAQEGVEKSKVIVVPLCYEQEAPPNIKRPLKPNALPLKVLWLGQIVLRKGIPYFFEAARQLAATRIQFTVAGRIGISPAALASAPPNVVIEGKVSRQRALELMAEADVFVLPTLSDGFALTQLEAMSFGLPVIATRHCGEVVEDGTNGCIIPAADAAALVEAILKLDRDRELLQKMSEEAIATPKQQRFTLDYYATTIEGALASLISSRHSLVAG
ncbi:MAG: glycosyltransferase family 4 protein [Planctomycetota bacterium]|nr:glycosyltransferase family 4 protein [Planctomycetota bacterium]